MLELAYLRTPEVFARDSATRRSKARQQLREETGMDDGQLEGWKIMLDRNVSLGHSCVVNGQELTASRTRTRFWSDTACPGLRRATGTRTRTKARARRRRRKVVVVVEAEAEAVGEEAAAEEGGEALAAADDQTRAAGATATPPALAEETRKWPRWEPASRHRHRRRHCTCTLLRFMNLYI